MGAWGIQTFENDKALDWMHEFRSNPSEQVLTDAFEGKFPPCRPGFFDKLLRRELRQPKESIGEYVLAAAEVVATLSGLPPESLPEDLIDLPNLDISKTISGRAIQAVDGMLEDSWLQKCWEQETDIYADWLSTVQDLRERLVSSCR